MLLSCLLWCSRVLSSLGSREFWWSASFLLILLLSDGPSLSKIVFRGWSPCWFVFSGCWSSSTGVFFGVRSSFWVPSFSLCAFFSDSSCLVSSWIFSCSLSSAFCLSAMLLLYAIRSALYLIQSSFLRFTLFLRLALRWFLLILSCFWSSPSSSSLLSSYDILASDLFEECTSGTFGGVGSSTTFAI